jgi:hypothetical protein
MVPFDVREGLPASQTVEVIATSAATEVDFRLFLRSAAMGTLPALFIRGGNP